LLLTGARGIGKTTVLINIVDALKAGGFSVGGMISRKKPRQYNQAFAVL
jgi:nucleoside-triphosphatase THEP1